MSKKKFVGEDGKEFIMKEKKPFYKKIWFWIIIILAIIVVGVKLTNNSEKGASSSEDTAKVTESNKEGKDALKKAFKVGDVVDYKGYKIKVNSVNYSDGDDMNKPDTSKKYIILNITITNNTGDKQSYNPYDFKLNANGNSTDVNEIVTDDIAKDELSSGDLDDGASVTGNLVGQANTSEKLKLQYKTSVWNDETVDIALN